MIVHPHRRPFPGVEVPLTPLIDMVFLLLIYFLLTTNFLKDEGIDIHLPEAQSAARRQGVAIVVTVSAEGEYLIDNERVVEEGLEAELRRLLSANADKAVLVRADRQVALELAVGALDSARAAGARGLGLATEKGK